jgi:hypothetical protein
LIPVVYVMNTKFAENINGFWFKESVLGVTVMGGPGYAWYLMVAAAIIAFVCAVAFLMKKTVPKESAIDTAAPPIQQDK